MFNLTAEDKTIKNLKRDGFVLRQPTVTVENSENWGSNGKEFRYLVTGSDVKITSVVEYGDGIAGFYNKDGEVHDREVFGHGSTPMNAWRDAIANLGM